MVKEILSEYITFELRPRWEDGDSRGKPWRKKCPSRRNSKYKGPAVRSPLACSRAMKHKALWLKHRSEMGRGSATHTLSYKTVGSLWVNTGITWRALKTPVTWDPSPEILFNWSEVSWLGTGSLKLPPDDSNVQTGWEPLTRPEGHAC